VDVLKTKSKKQCNEKTKNIKNKKHKKHVLNFYKKTLRTFLHLCTIARTSLHYPHVCEIDNI